MRGSIFMAKFIAIANQKGGVGKTTTAMNLGVALKLQGKRVLLVDFDSQANLSEYLNFENENEDKTTISDLMLSTISNEPIDIKEYIYHDDVNDMDYIPSDLNLATVENYLANAMLRETVLKRALTGAETVNTYDYVIIDCPPTLAILLINVLGIADGVIIPVQTHKFAWSGLSKLTDIVDQSRTMLNRDLKIVGVLPTMVDNTKVSKSIFQRLKDTYGELVFNTSIPKCVEAPNSVQDGVSVCLIKNSKLRDSYTNLATEVVTRLS
jgi:chromosome partitioning protein